MVENNLMILLIIGDEIVIFVGIFIILENVIFFLILYCCICVNY